MEQARSSAAAGFMARIINRQLMFINSRFLPTDAGPAHHQPMVDKAMASRLKQLMADTGLSRPQIAELAEVSTTAVMKWMKGGNVTDATLRKLVSKEPLKSRGITVAWIRYGDTQTELPIVGESVPSYLTPEAVNVARIWMHLSPGRRAKFFEEMAWANFFESKFPPYRLGIANIASHDKFTKSVEADWEKMMRQAKLPLEER
jgi:transcriptional regulator with XRE-family HTH domain